MKRMVLSLLIFGLITISPVFAGKVAPDESSEKDSITAGVENIKTKDKLSATEDMVKDLDENVEKTKPCYNSTEKPKHE